MSKFIDITGNKYNKLTVIKRVTSRIKGVPRWLCQCECGNYTEVDGRNLKNNAVKSCGCLLKDPANAKHFGEPKRKIKTLEEIRLYRIFRGIFTRCNNKNNPAYKNYGARGITICDEWKNSFNTFYKWAIENGYKLGLTIERIDVNKNYEPSNCKWISKGEQNFNKRNSYNFTINGKTQCLSVWCREYEMPYLTVYNRITKFGMPIEEALNKPINISKRNKLYKGGNKNDKCDIN